MRTLAVALVLPVALAAALPAAAGPAADEALLRESKIAPDGPSLLAFFRARTLSDAERARLPRLAALLGDEDFSVREKAAADLIAAGAAAVPALRAVLGDDDRERARRAEDCLRAIRTGADSPLIAAAARALAARRPPGAAAALLAYLPIAPGEDVEQALLDALASLTLRDGVADPVILAALADADGARRAAAAFVVGRAGDAARRRLPALLADDDPRACFEAARALLRAGDRRAVPVLIALVGKGPHALARQAHDLLCRLDNDRAADLPWPLPADEGRAAAHDAWADWWRNAGARLDLTKIDLAEATLGLTLVCELGDGVARRRVSLCRPDGKTLWETAAVPFPADARLLPDGRVLIADQLTGRVTEHDPTTGGVGLLDGGHRGHASVCQRLHDGNTFIATSFELFEVTPAHRVVFSYRRGEGEVRIVRATRLPGDRCVLLLSDGQLVELGADGREARRLRLPVMVGGLGGVEALPGGRYLVAASEAGRILEIDAAGKVVWEVEAPGVASAVRLANGHTLAALSEQREVIEYDRAGRVVWKLTTTGRPVCARRY
jgi:hypothetical protein